MNESAADLTWESMEDAAAGAVRPSVVAPETEGPKRLPLAILGILFDSLTLSETIEEIQTMIASGRPHRLVTANLDFLVQALEDVELRRIIVESDRVLCDGTPLIWASALFGNRLPQRVAGADLVPELMRVAAKEGYRPFFLGGAPEVAAQAVANLVTRFPRLNIAGHYSPPVRPLLDMDHREIARQIRAARPDLLLVSFGCPKAEKWIAMHGRALGVPVTIGVGATIDFLAGRVRRAPVWMQRSGIEWIFRLAQEPQRLAQRYGNDLVQFARQMPAQWWRMQFRLRKKNGIIRSSAILVEPLWSRVPLPEHLDREMVRANQAVWQQALQRHCLLEADRVEFIDSTGLGLLLWLRRELRAAGHQLVLLAPSRVVRDVLGRFRLEDFFLLAPTALAARELIVEQSASVAIPGFGLSAGIAQPWRWRGEITAGNARECWKAIRWQLQDARSRWEELTVDLSELRFIDSTGAGLLVRAKKEAAARRLTLRLTAAHANVRNVLRLLQLERFILDAAE